MNVPTGREKDVAIEFLDYEWALNDTAEAR